MKTIIDIYPHDPSIVGKYPFDADSVIVLCHSTVAFPVTLPDSAGASKTIEIGIKNAGSNSVTIATVSGQYIDSKSVRSKVLSAGEYVSYVPDQKSAWITLGNT